MNNLFLAVIEDVDSPVISRKLSVYKDTVNQEIRRAKSVFLILYLLSDISLTNETINI